MRHSVYSCGCTVPDGKGRWLDESCRACHAKRRAAVAATQEPRKPVKPGRDGVIEEQPVRGFGNRAGGHTR